MAAPTEDDIKKLQKQINELNEKLDEMSGNMAKINKDSEGVSKNIGDSKNLLEDAVLSVRNISSEFRKFATDSKEQYKYAEKLAETSKSTAVNIGISVGRSHEFTKSFNRATAEVQKFGGTAENVNTIMTKFSDANGRARIISPEEVKNIFLLEKGLGVGIESASALAERMDLMGVSVQNSSQFLNKLTVDSQKLGLNASQVAKTLANNFDKMSSYSFKGGVKGMMEMSKLAVKMRMDVSDMLSMADKFYNPEGAIEAAAELQLLGGDIAEAFGDPFETMYLARNKPQELAEKVGKMTENMLQFNEESGEYELPPEARQQFEALSKTIGGSAESLIDMARQSAKIKDIKMNVSGNIVDEDMREGLASMAKMKDGKWVVDFDGKEIGIDEIGVDMAEKMLAAPKNEEEAIMDMAKNSMTTNQILQNILEAMKTGYVAETNVYELTEDILRPGMDSLMEGTEKQIQKTIEYLQTTPYGKLREAMLEQAQLLGITTGEGIQKVFDADFTKGLKDALKELDLKTSLEDILTELKKMGGEDVIKKPGDPIVREDFMMRSSGEVTSFTNEDDIIGAKRGGPLDKLMDKNLSSGGNSGTIPSKIEFGTLDVSGRIEIVSPDGSTKNMDIESIKPDIIKTIISHLNGTFRNGGVPSSKEASDYMG
jgi:DNA-binding ferritin-like protein (Dps family)